MKFQAHIQKQLCIASICSEAEIKKRQKKLSSVKSLAQITEFSKIIADPTRSRVVYLLYTYTALCVCDIANILGISVASASQHLRKMYDKGLVTTKKQGLTIFYAICNEKFIKFLKCHYEKKSQ